MLLYCFFLLFKHNTLDGFLWEYWLHYFIKHLSEIHLTIFVLTSLTSVLKTNTFSWFVRCLLWIWDSNISSLSMYTRTSNSTVYNWSNNLRPPSHFVPNSTNLFIHSHTKNQADCPFLPLISPSQHSITSLPLKYTYVFQSHVSPLRRPPLVTVGINTNAFFNSLSTE